MGPISTKLGTKHPWVKGIQVLTDRELFNSQIGDNVLFLSLNQRYGIIIALIKCIWGLELFLR